MFFKRVTPNLKWSFLNFIFTEKFKTLLQVGRITLLPKDKNQKHTTDRTEVCP
jgi:hypothetical protein